MIKSEQRANQHSVITKANMQKALSISVLLRHPLPLQSSTLALVFPPSVPTDRPPAPHLLHLHPTLPVMSQLPQMHFLNSCSPFCIYFLSFYLVFILYSLALALSLLLLREHPPHIQCSFSVFFL